MRLELQSRLKQWLSLLEIPAPDSAEVMRRIRVMERHIILPAKAAIVLMLFHSFFYSPWMGIVSSALDVAVETTISLFWIYVGINVVGSALILLMDRMPISVVQWTVITLSMVDAIFLAGLTLVTGGYDSILFWLFVCQIVRNAVSVPPSAAQLILNFATTICYLLACVSDLVMTSYLEERLRMALGLDVVGNPAEPVALRLLLLWLLVLCTSGVQLLLERQRLAAEEAREFAVRESQLRSAGRLAAEIAHQLKNPLAIINNSVFSLGRLVKECNTPAEDQIHIVQEEVDRADRILTQVMGYAQLSEGRVEKLNVSAELEGAIRSVFPPAAEAPVRVIRDYSRNLPPLLMQRGHLSEILMNLLQNARAATKESGEVRISARSQPDHSLEITISDNGPGIPPHRTERIFEAYFTTREKGTGLGLSIAKHNVELYGGTISVESELGKGARFTIVFPERMLIKPRI